MKVVLGGRDSKPHFVARLIGVWSLDKSSALANPYQAGEAYVRADIIVDTVTLDNRLADKPCAFTVLRAYVSD